MLTKKSHHSLKESYLYGHVSSCEHASYLLEVSTKESVATPCIGLHGDPITRQICIAVKELALRSHGLKSLIVILIFAQKQTFYLWERYSLCLGSNFEDTILVVQVSRKLALQSIRAELKWTVILAISLKLTV